MGMDTVYIYNRLENATSKIGPNGTEENGPTYGTGKFFTGLDIVNNNNNDRMNFAFDTSASHTFDFWVKHNVSSGSFSGTGFYIVLTPSGGKSTNGDFRISYSAANGLTVRVQNASGVTSNNYNGATFAADELIHYRVIVSQNAVISSDKVIAYMNGERLTLSSGDETEGLSQTDTGGTLTIGNYIDLNRGMQGVIDNLKVYASADTELGNDVNREGFGGPGRRRIG